MDWYRRLEACQHPLSRRQRQGAWLLPTECLVALCAGCSSGTWTLVWRIGSTRTFLPWDFSITTPASALGTCSKAAAARPDRTSFMESSRRSGSSAPVHSNSVGVH